jgi:transcriptional regulator with XRE-family HTH domain
MEEFYYKRLRELREDHDLTQREVATIIGMPQTQYIRYEQGKRDIPTPALKRLCLLYKISADYILELPKNLGWITR